MKYAALLHRHTILHTVGGQLARGEIEHDYVMKLRRANEKSDENSTEKDNSKWSEDPREGNNKRPIFDRLSGPTNGD